jgi:SAM-dependent methyltransferase
MHDEFCAASGLPKAEISRLPLEDGTVDRVVILAVLHHFTIEERAQLYAECMRVLRPGRGRMIVADVIDGSPQARWLNGFVDEFCPQGHKGRFFTAADADLMLDCGFGTVSVRRTRHHWFFATHADRTAFLRGIFCLGEDAPLDASIAETLRRTPSGGPLRGPGEPSARPAKESGRTPSEAKESMRPLVR